MRRIAVVVLLTAATALTTAPSALAGIWTPIASGTTDDITAIDARGPGDLLYATSNGKIFRNGVQQFSQVGVSFTDIALNPSGTVGLATALNGGLYRFSGATWTQVGGLVTRDPASGPCSGNATVATTPVTGNLVAVAWKDDMTAYVPSKDVGVVLKTTNGGASFTDVSRQVDGTCRAGTNDEFTDVAVVPGTDLVYLLAKSFGARWVSSNGLAGAAVRRGETSVNCFQNAPRIALDQSNPNRNFVVGGFGCDGTLGFGYSADAGTSYDIQMDYLGGRGDTLQGLADVAVAGGSALAAGRAGAIVVSPDGARAYFQRADGGDQTTDWLAVDKSSAGDGAVAGIGGRLLVSAQANAIPDVVPPAGTISGPTRIAAGQPATFTANVADNAGGSGINPAAFAWSATGVPSASGNPTALTFPSAGFYTVRVTFADNTGNTGEATLGVTVGPAAPAPNPVRTTTVKVVGGSLDLGAPRACIPAGSSFSATLAFKRSTTRVTATRRTVIKVTRVVFTINGTQRKTDRKAPFRQRMTVRNLKAGTKHTLRARATMKVRRGKGPTKSITTKITVCG